MLKVTDNLKKSTKFSNLKPGDVFVTGAGNVYIKISSDESDYNCFNLNDFTRNSFLDLLVTPVQSELIITS